MTENMVPKKRGRKYLDRCALCEKITIRSDGCSEGAFYHDGKKYRRIRVGDSGDMMENNVDLKKRCPDCYARPGHYHHHGCTCERCPVCGETFAFCSCEGAYDLGPGDATEFHVPDDDKHTGEDA